MLMCYLHTPLHPQPRALSCEKIRGFWSLSGCFVSRHVFDENSSGLEAVDKLRFAPRSRPGVAQAWEFSNFSVKAFI